MSCAVRDSERLHAIERHGIGRLAREADAVVEPACLRLDQRDRSIPASTARCFASLANGTPRACPLNVPSAFSVILSPGRAGATDIAPCGRVQSGARQQPAGEQRFGERHRGGVAPGDAQHREAVGKFRARAAVVPPAPRRASARHRRAPATAGLPGVVARAVDLLRVGQIGKNPRRRFGDDRPALAHGVSCFFRSPGQWWAEAARKAWQRRARAGLPLRPSSGLPRRMPAISVRPQE